MVSLQTAVQIIRHLIHDSRVPEPFGQNTDYRLKNEKAKCSIDKQKANKCSFQHELNELKEKIPNSDSRDKATYLLKKCSFKLHDKANGFTYLIFR
jgi:hypothetical protein